MAEQSDGSEVYGTSQKKVDLPTAVAQAQNINQLVVEEDDLSVSVAIGTECQRKGCYHKFVDEETSRTGNSPCADCHFHPAPVVFLSSGNPGADPITSSLCSERGAR